jgi:flavodoxin I
MAEIGIFFGSTTGKTRMAAEAIQQAFGRGRVDLFDIAKATPSDLSSYRLLILGVSTWGIGDLQDDWDINLNLLEQVDFSGKRVALFGLGDASGYPDSFLDAMGSLYEAVRKHGVETIGHWSAEDYLFTASRAINEGRFVGLALDADNEDHMSRQRISQWVDQLTGEAGLQGETEWKPC